MNYNNLTICYKINARLKWYNNLIFKPPQRGGFRWGYLLILVFNHIAVI